LKNRTGYTHWEAAKTLSQIGSPKSVQVMVALLEDHDLGVRWLGAEGLITIGEDSLKPLLTALIHNSGSSLLRTGTHHVLQALVRRQILEQPLQEKVKRVMASLESIEPALVVLLAAKQALDALPEENLDIETG